MAAALVIGVLIVGFQRAAFSNEAGVGSASIAHSASRTKHPVSEGLVSLLEPFIDTLIICYITGLVIVATGTWSQTDPETGEQISAALMTGEAFSYGLPGQWGHWVVTIGLMLFAFSTMLFVEASATDTGVWNLLHFRGGDAPPGHALPGVLLTDRICWCDRRT